MPGNEKAKKRAAKKAAKQYNKRKRQAPPRRFGKPVMKKKDERTRMGYKNVGKKKYPKYKGHTPSKKGVSKKVRKTYPKK